MERKLRLSAIGAIRFCILFGAVAWAWWYFRSYFLFVALAMMPVCVLLSVLILWYAGNGMRARIELPSERVGKNSEICLSVRVENPLKMVGLTADIRYQWGNVFTDRVQSKQERLWIAPGKGADRKLLLESCYAGRLEVQIEKFLVYDLFHIFCLSGCDKQGASMIAYPAFVLGEEEDIRSCVDGFPKEEENKKRGIDYNPDYEVREYIPGDELKSIHWKLTAKQNRMMVRERLASGRQKINVLLALEDDRARNDLLMDSLYALCRLLLKKEYPIQLFWPGREEILRTRFLTEQGELENVIGEILSGCGLNIPGNVQSQMAVEYPGENYILVQTGVYKGAYIQ